MKLLKTENVSSVILFDLQLSEGELQYIGLAMNYVLRHLSKTELHAAFNDERGKTLQTEQQTHEFLEMEYEHIMNLIKRFCRPEFLPDHFLHWEMTSEECDA